MMCDDRTHSATIACLGCGYVLDGLESTQCPECGTSFDHSDPATFRRILQNPMRIARLSIGEASAAALALNRMGIPVQAEPESGRIIGHIDLPQGSLWVNREDEERARVVLNELVHRRETRESWTCPNCGEVLEPQFEACWNCGA